MTDGPQGPGWWQASDLQWYPPERHPSYQAPHTPQTQTGSPPSGLPSYGQPNEGIAVTTKTFRIGTKLLKPKLIVDGSEIPAVRWGRTVIPTLPGQHHVHVHVPYFAWPRRIGPADTDVAVYPGKLTELEYRRPAWPYSAGSLGAGPQRYNGVGLEVRSLRPTGVRLLVSAPQRAYRGASHKRGPFLFGAGQNAPSVIGAGTPVCRKGGHASWHNVLLWLCACRWRTFPRDQLLARKRAAQ